MSHHENPSPNRRRRKFIRPDLQLKLTLGALVVAFFVLVFNLQAPLLGLYYLQGVYANFDPQLYDSVQQVILLSFLVSAVLTIPLALWLGIVYSFKFCGPIYKLQKHLETLASGNWAEVCRLRQGDDLQDIKDRMNEFSGAVCERMQTQKELLASAHERLATGRDVARPDPGLDALLDGLQEEMQRVDQHLATPAPEPVETPEETLA